MCVCVYVCVYVYMCVCVYVYMCVCVYVWLIYYFHQTVKEYSNQMLGLG